jgi:hypothetical protein
LPDTPSLLLIVIPAAGAVRERVANVPEPVLATSPVVLSAAKAVKSVSAA